MKKGISQYVNIWIECISLVLLLGSLAHTLILFGWFPGNSMSAPLADAPFSGRLVLFLLWIFLYLQIPLLAHFKFGKQARQTKKQHLLHAVMVWKIHWMKISISILFTILSFFNNQQATAPEYNSNGLMTVSVMLGFMAVLIFGLFYLNRYSHKIETLYGSATMEEQGINNPPIHTSANGNTLAHYVLTFMMMVFPFVVIFILLVFSVVQQ